MKALLGPDATANRIEGTWNIDGDQIELVVDVENQKPRTVELPIDSTGVIRIETPQRQYVSGK